MRQAVSSAGLETSEADRRGRKFRLEAVDPGRVGVYMGTGVGGANSFLENHYHPILSRQKQALLDIAESDNIDDTGAAALRGISERMYHLRRVNPFIVSMLMPNAVSAAIGNACTTHGPNTTYCVACASGTVALGKAFCDVRSGEVDIAIAGGSEYLDDHYGYIFKGFDVAGTLATGDDPRVVNCPFDAERTGFLYSEGASAVLMLEERERALRRGAPVIAEVAGYAETFDAHNMMSPAPDGEQIERMIRTAISSAAETPERVDYVNAHGTGTPVNDRVEAEVLGRVFGHGVCINSTKSLIGHSIGASGAVEALVTALTLRDGAAHGSKNLRDPVSDLDFAFDRRDHPFQVGLSESFAFGGHNAAVVLRRHEN
jgi:3-oxoacyl-[acyl-carrier-protein] synthase II